ncbi:MAG: hypothetical protein KatS3mg072_0069 [Meiothermus sp.]|nr:MAG: hypothetical protein KatS3mg072_0069 [Meiothermus sp.]
MPAVTSVPAIGYALALGDLDIGVTAGSQCSHEDLGLPHLARGRVGDAQRLTSVIHEQLVARLVIQAHGRVQAPAPIAVLRGEGHVPVGGSLGLGGSIFLPQLQQRHTGTLALLVDVRPVGFGTLHTPPQAGLEQPGFERHIVQILGQRPAQARFLGPPHVLPDGASTQPDAERDVALLDPKPPLQP